MSSVKALLAIGGLAGTVLVAPCFLSWTAIATLSSGGAMAAFVLLPKDEPLKPRAKEEYEVSSSKSDDKAIRVTVERAIHLPPMDLDGKADPYVVVRFGGVEHKTRKVMDSLNPKWNEVFVFKVSKAASQDIQFKVMDWDPESKDDVVGYVKIPIDDVKKNPENKRSIGLTNACGEKVRSKEGQPSMLDVKVEYLEGQPERNNLWLTNVMTKVLKFWREKINEKVKRCFDGIPFIHSVDFDIGEEAPIFRKIRPLLTRSKENIQLECHLHWEPAELLIRVGFSFIQFRVRQIVLDVPAWIGVRLNQKEGGCGYDPAVVEFAATNTPTVTFDLDLKVGDRAVPVPFFRPAVDGVVQELARRWCNQDGLPKKQKKIFHTPAKPIKENRDAGRLFVSVVEAVYLKETNTYVRVSLGSSAQAETRTISSRTPEWQEVLQLSIPSDYPEAQIQIMEDGRSKPLQEIRLKKEEYAHDDGSICEQWHQLDGDSTSGILIKHKYEAYVDQERQLPAWGEAAGLKSAVVPVRREKGKATLWINEAQNLADGKERYVKVLVHRGDDKPTLLLSTERTKATKRDASICCTWDQMCCAVAGEGELVFTFELKHKSATALRSTLQGTAQLTLDQVKAKSKDGMESEPFYLTFKDASGADLESRDGKSGLRLAVTWEPAAGRTGEDAGLEWMNRLLEQGYTLFKPQLTSVIEAALKNIIDNLPFESIPLVDHLCMRNDMELGNRPPTVKCVQFRSSFDDHLVELELHLSWVVDRHMKLHVDAQVELPIKKATAEGTKVVAEFPAWVQVNLRGSEGPQDPLIKISATEEPQLHFEAELQRIGSVPVAAEAALRDIVVNAVLMALKEILVLPAYIQIPADPDVPLPILDKDKQGQLEKAEASNQLRQLDRLRVKGSVRIQLPKTMEASTVKVVSKMHLDKELPLSKQPRLQRLVRSKEVTVQKGRFSDLNQSVVLDVVDDRDEVVIQVGEDSPWRVSVNDLKQRQDTTTERIGDLPVTLSFEKLYRQGWAVEGQAGQLVSVGGRRADLEVKVCRVENLPRNSRFHKHPHGRRYVAVTAGGDRKKTRVWDQSGPPAWEESLWFRSAALDQEQVELEILDDSRRGKVLGRVCVGRAQLTENGGQNQYPVLNDKGEQVVNSHNHQAILYLQTRVVSQRRDDVKESEDVCCSSAGEQQSSSAAGQPAEQAQEKQKGPGKITVTVVSAKDLKDMDQDTLTAKVGYDVSDPYVVLKLGNEKRETSVIMNNLNPAWPGADGAGERFEFPRVAQDSQLLLNVDVFDRDTKKKFDDFLGCVDVSVKDIVEGKYEADTPFDLKQERPKPFWQKDDQGRQSSLTLRIKFEEHTVEELEALRKEHLSIHIFKCTDLPKTDTFGHCDPYVLVDVSGRSKGDVLDRKNCDCSTETVKNDKDPVYEKGFDRQFQKHQLPDELRFAVWDWNRRTDKLVGEVKLQTKDIRALGDSDGGGPWFQNGLQLLDAVGNPLKYKEKPSLIFVRAWITETDS